MEASQITRTLAPKDNLPRDMTGCVISPRDRVMIPKGTLVYSKGEVKISRTSRIIRVNWCYKGYELEGLRKTVRGAPRVVWAGQGGYWVECEAQDVRIVP